MRINFVLIDLENVKPQSVALLDQDHFRVLVFVGASQAKVPMEFADSLQRLGSKAEYIRISGNGPNALDFHIAYYIGRLAIESPDAFFHVVSRDTGFDPLIAHLNSQKVFAGRVRSIEDIPLVKAANTSSLAERVAVVMERLQRMKNARPRKVATLSSTIASLFQKQLSEDEVNEVLEALKKKGAINVSGTKVAYALDQGD